MQEKILTLLEKLPLAGMHPAEVIDAQPTIEAFEQDIKETFAQYFDRDFVEERFRLPEDFKAYLQVCKSTYHKNIWEYLFDANLIMRSHDSYLGLFADELLERRQEQQAHAADTLWINFGSWADWHDYLICCDHTSPAYGKIFDSEDNHPWMGNGSDFKAEYADYDSFLQFLEENYKEI